MANQSHVQSIDKRREKNVSWFMFTKSSIKVYHKWFLKARIWHVKSADSPKKATNFFPFSFTLTLFLESRLHILQSKNCSSYPQNNQRKQKWPNIYSCVHSQKLIEKETMKIHSDTPFTMQYTITCIAKPIWTDSGRRKRVRERNETKSKEIRLTHLICILFSIHTHKL